MIQFIKLLISWQVIKYHKKHIFAYKKYVYTLKPDLVSYKKLQKIIASNKEWCIKKSFLIRKYSLPVVWY